MQLIKRWLTTIIGILVLSIPGFLKADVYLVNVICSVVATVLFSISICFDDNWKLKEEIQIKHKEKLEKIQSILFISVLLFSKLRSLRITTFPQLWIVLKENRRFLLYRFIPVKRKRMQLTE